MTPERLRELRASLVGQTDRDKAIELLAEVEGMRVEIERLRALPVLRTCADCGYCVTDLHVGEWCDRDEQQRDTERESPPPSWCPLRGAR